MNSKKSIRLLFIFISVLYSYNSLSQDIQRVWNGDLYEEEIIGGVNFQFEKARYRLFIPKDCKYIRGILIHQHGCTMEGTGAPITTDIQYQAFAKKWDLAILGPDLYPHEKKCMEWSDPSNGSEKSLLMALDSLAIHSGHPEINSAPWLLWGHSGGGHWALSMFSRYPERTIALVAYSAAFDPTFVYSLKSAKVPVFLRHAGKYDYNGCYPTALHQFDALRKINGWVSIANNAPQNQNHNISHIRLITIPFFESVLEQRLPSKDECSLRDMDSRKAWLGDTTLVNGLNLYKELEYTGNKYELSRLPDSLFAVKYREYCLTGTVLDITPPTPPYFTSKQKLQNHTTEFYWKADADIESGISHFNIYKNGKMWKRLPGKGIFQTYNTNGDEPIPPVAPEMKICIKDNEYCPRDIISLSTVNRDGLESIKIVIK